MRTSMIALLLAISALGLGSFATFKALDDNPPEVITQPAATFAAPQGDGATTMSDAETGWTALECFWAKTELKELGWRCFGKGDCAPGYDDKLFAIADNCR